MAENINIAGRLHSTATGNVVAGANEIYDDAKGKKQSVVNQETDAALDDRYTKSQTYNKTELNSMITTPNQEYVSVTATDQTTAATDVLPATGSADTTYRVGNWDGSQFDASVYSEYAWDGSQYVHLSTKTQVGEVFDISAYHATGGTLATYADLAAALDSNNGGGVPQSLRKGGMSVKYVHTSDNKYVQWRYMGTAVTGTPNPFLDTANWQGVDKDELSAGSENVTTSNAVLQSIVEIRSQKCGKNILDDLAIVNNRAISNDGELYYSQYYWASLYIPYDASKGSIIGTNIRTGSYKIEVFCYDESKAFLGMLSATYTSPINPAGTYQTTKYIKVHGLKSAGGNNQLEYGTTATNYESFSYVGSIENIISSHFGIFKKVCAFQKMNPNAIFEYDQETKKIKVVGTAINSSNDIFRVIFENNEVYYIQGAINTEVNLSGISSNGYLYFQTTANHNITDISFSTGTPSSDTYVVGYYWYGKYIWSPIIEYKKEEEVVTFNIADFVKELYIDYTPVANKVYYINTLQRNYYHSSAHKYYWRFDIWEADDLDGTNKVNIAEFISNTNYDNIPFVSGVTTGNYHKMEAIVNWQSLVEGVSDSNNYQLDNTIFDMVYSPTLMQLQKTSIDVDFSIASKLYVRKNIAENYYHENVMIDNSIGANLYLDNSPSVPGTNYRGMRDLPRLGVTHINTDSDVSCIAKILKNNYTLKEKQIQIRVGDTSDDTGNIIFHLIGDSQARGWQSKAAQEICPNMTCIGAKDFNDFHVNPLTKSDAYPGQTLSSLLSVATLYNQYGYQMSLFLHPSGNYANYRFLGKTNTWKASRSTTSEYTGCLKATANLLGMSSTTGKPETPLTNDMIYDYDLGKIQYYDGSAWVDFDGTWEDLGLTFNYGRFLQVYQLSTPTHVCIQIGANDFDSGWGAASLTFVSNLEIVIQSILQTGAVVIICTPLARGINSVRPGCIEDYDDYRRYMLRKTIIDNFDNRENEGIYVIDSGSAIDKNKDYSIIDIENNSPTIFEPADKTLAVAQTELNPWMDGMTFDENHPINSSQLGGYLHIGERIAAFLQWWRAQ